jgi:hypothetical protein
MASAIGFAAGLNGAMQGLQTGMQLRRQKMLDDLARQQQEKDNAFRDAAMRRLDATQKATEANQLRDDAEKRRGTALAESDAPWSPYGRDKEVYSGIVNDTVNLPGTGPMYEESRSNRQYAIDNFGPQIPNVDPSLRAEVFGEVRKFDDPLINEAANRAARIRGEQHRLAEKKVDSAGEHAGARAMRVVTLNDGSLAVVNPTSATPTAVPVGTPGGAPAKAGKTIPPSEKNTLQSAAAEVRALEALQERFKDQFAGGGAVGGAATWLYQTLGSWGTQGMQQDAQFWADFQRMIDLPQRHALFGATFTPGERTSWDAAKNIKPGADPAVVTKALKTMAQLTARKLNEHGSALLSEGYNADAVRTLTNTGKGGSDPYAATRTKLQPGEVLIRRNGQIGGIAPHEVLPTDERL